MSEERLKIIFENYPYLIDECLRNFELVNRTYPDGSQPDLLFHNSKLCKTVIVELKSDLIDHNAVNQLVSYIRLEKRYYNCNVFGILIGKTISKTAENMIPQLNVRIKVKLLGTDVPEKIKFCVSCRQANWYNAVRCKYCGSKRFFE